ncbi:hypothetical protein [Cerasicoccus frondis]|uniref:hypothetical protein n=1 Tax=Cerasicoccus frondis TaxID=490090 RepID=UPI0028529237|nr:hypothetical protein [Cerasicoccus frondis]
MKNVSLALLMAIFWGFGSSDAMTHTELIDSMNKFVMAHPAQIPDGYQWDVADENGDNLITAAIKRCDNPSILNAIKTRFNVTYTLEHARLAIANNRYNMEFYIYRGLLPEEIKETNTTVAFIALVASDKMVYAKAMLEGGLIPVKHHELKAPHPLLWALRKKDFDLARDVSTHFDVLEFEEWVYWCDKDLDSPQSWLDDGGSIFYPYLASVHEPEESLGGNPFGSEPKKITIVDEVRGIPLDLSKNGRILQMLNQPGKEKLRLAVYKAILGDLQMEINQVSDNSIRDFDNYNKIDGAVTNFSFGVSGSYQLGRNARQSFSTTGNYTSTKTESTTDDEDVPTKVQIIVEEFVNEQLAEGFQGNILENFNPFTQVGVPPQIGGHTFRLISPLYVAQGSYTTFIAAWGGWHDRNFPRDDEPATARVDYSSRGKIAIKGCGLTDGLYPSALPYVCVDIGSGPSAQSIKVSQNGVTNTFRPGTIHVLNRYEGDIEITMAHSDSIVVSGSNAHSNQKSSGVFLYFQIDDLFPKIFDQSAKLANRIQVYCGIGQLRARLQDRDITEIEKVTTETYLHLLSEFAHKHYKAAILQDLDPVARYIQEVDASPLNRSLLVLLETRDVTLPETRDQLRDLLASIMADISAEDVDRLDQEEVASMTRLLASFDTQGIDDVIQNITSFKEKYLRNTQARISLYRLYVEELKHYLRNQTLRELLDDNNIPIVVGGLDEGEN